MVLGPSGLRGIVVFPGTNHSQILYIVDKNVTVCLLKKRALSLALLSVFPFVKDFMTDV